jgi:hypothetical protein
MFKPILKGLALFLLGVVLSGVVNTMNSKNFWKTKYHECQDNYEALVLENSELKDSLNVKINVVPKTLQVHD